MAGSIERIRLLHRGMEMDMNQTISTYNFQNDYNLMAIESVSISSGDSDSLTSSVGLQKVLPSKADNVHLYMSWADWVGD